MNMNKKTSLIILSCAILLSGCSYTSIKGNVLSQKVGASMPDLVAIFPPDNQSNDVTAVEVIQRAGGVMLAAKGYFGIANKAQDELLRKMGITDGGQLKAYKGTDLCGKLGVNGLLYSTVEDFNEVNIGFYMSRKVLVNFKLTDCAEDILWEGKGKYNAKQLEINPQTAAQNFVARKVGELVEKALKVHLVMESNLAAMALGQKITPWPDLETIKKKK